MELRTRSNQARARAIAAGACSALCALVLAAPMLASSGYHGTAAAVYFCFSRICHQIPTRSFSLLGYSLAVCHRCSGIYLGFFIGTFINIPWIHRSPCARRNWTLTAILPLAADFLIPYSGLWTNTCVSRFATGLIFGVVVSSLFVRGLAEFLDEAPWNRLAISNSHLKGGLS
jgi:uncharacterized membrane protein